MKSERRKRFTQDLLDGIDKPRGVLYSKHMIRSIAGRRPLVEPKPAVEPPEALPDRVSSVLKYPVLTRALAPGQRLKEKAIADELAVSRTPLREALNRLAQENLLARTPYRGYAVAPVTVEDIQNLCVLRVILETAAAGLAAERATPEELKRLAGCVDLRYTPGDRETYSAYLTANSIFDRELARASHNDRLESMVMPVLDELQRPLYLGLDWASTPPMHTSFWLRRSEIVTSHARVGCRRNRSHAQAST
jgi:DNA-binding GntR family transcriptional regulator